MTRLKAIQASFLALTAAVAVVSSPTSTHAQLVDQGVFDLSINGEPAGTEEFTIQRSGTGEAQFVPITFKGHWEVIRKIDAANNVQYNCK